MTQSQFGLGIYQPPNACRAGLAYENLLYTSLQHVGAAFWQEDMLRAKVRLFIRRDTFCGYRGSGGVNP